MRILQLLPSPMCHVRVPRSDKCLQALLALFANSSGLELAVCRASVAPVLLLLSGKDDAR